MSGASGKVPAAIHVTPEAQLDGALAKVRDGDTSGSTRKQAGSRRSSSNETLRARSARAPHIEAAAEGFGRELFATFRQLVSTAESGASPLQ